MESAIVTAEPLENFVRTTKSGLVATRITLEVLNIDRNIQAGGDFLIDLYKEAIA